MTGFRVKRTMTVEDAVNNVKSSIGSDITLLFCRDYGDIYLLFYKTSDGEEINETAISKNSGKVISPESLNGRDWIPVFNLGGESWNSMQ